MHLPDRSLLTVSQVAEATSLSPNAIYRAIRNDELRASKLRGRLRVQEFSWTACAEGLAGLYRDAAAARRGN